MPRSSILLTDFLGAASVVAVAAAAVFYWLAPNREEAARRKIADYQIRSARAALADQQTRQERLRQRLAESVRELDRLYFALPADQDLGEFIVRMGQAAEDTGVRLEEVSPGSLEPDGRFARTQISLKAAGTWSQVLEWLDTLSDSIPYLRFSELSVRREANDTASLRRFNLKAHVLLRRSPDGPLAIYQPARNPLKGGDGA